VSDITFVFCSFMYFEPVKISEIRSDGVMFWSFSNSAGESILNSLEAVDFGDVYVQEKIIAVF